MIGVDQARGFARRGLLWAPRPVRRIVLRLIGKAPPRQLLGTEIRRRVRPPVPTAEEKATFNRSYIGPRPELVDRLPDTARRVLDLGCATGIVGAHVKLRAWGASVTGVELDPAMAARAAERLDRVVALDLEDVDAVLGELGENAFDGMIAGDILEHLVDPWRALRALARVIEPGGWVVASLPNVGYWATWRDVVLRGRWPYRPRGVHDTTHLRFFARRNVEPLFEQAGFEVIRVDRAYRLIDVGHPWDRHAHWLAIPGLRGLLTYQMLVVARRREGVVPPLERGLGDHGELVPPAP